MQAPRLAFDTALAPGVRALLVLPIAVVLAGIVGVSTAASHEAVLHMSSQFQQGGCDRDGDGSERRDLAAAPAQSALPNCTAGSRHQAG